MDTNNQVIITEVGTFGSLNIEDPTVTDIKKKKNPEDVDKLIAEAITENASIVI